MRNQRIIVDLGMTLYDRRERIQIDDKLTYPLFGGAQSALLWWKLCGHKLYVVSKIDPDTEKRVMGHLYLSRLVPDVFEKENIFFCYRREEKGGLAQRIRADICIDDRVEALNAMDEAGVRHKILFTGGHDDRNEHKLAFDDIIICNDWLAVERAVQHLP